MPLVVWTRLTPRPRQLCDSFEKTHSWADSIGRGSAGHGGRHPRSRLNSFTTFPRIKRSMGFRLPKCPSVAEVSGKRPQRVAAEGRSGPEAMGPCDAMSVAALSRPSYITLNGFDIRGRSLSWFRRIHPLID